MLFPRLQLRMSKSRLEFKKFSAAIKVDGKELECYAVLDDKSGKSVSCWIASEEGKVTVAFSSSFYPSLTLLTRFLLGGVHLEFLCDL